MSTFLIAALATLAPLAQDAEREAYEPRLDADVQRVIHTCVHAATPAERDATLIELGTLARNDAPALVTQLFLYSEAATTTRDGMAFGLLREPLALRDADLLAALIPVFESSKPDLRRGAAGALSEFEGADARTPPDFGVYRAWVTEGRLRAGFARHLFTTSPAAALTLLESVQGAQTESKSNELSSARRALEAWQDRERRGVASSGAKHVLLTHLDTLRTHDAWWARAFVAAVLIEHPPLSRAGWLAKLQTDKHRLVRAITAP